MLSPSTRTLSLRATALLVTSFIALILLFGLQVPAHADITSGLVGHWTFDNTLNDSAGSNHGILVGSPTYTTGKLNQALNFNGAGDTVNAGSASVLDDLGPVTYAFWINPDTLVDGRRILSKNSSSGLSTEIRIDTNNRFRLQVSHGASASNHLLRITGNNSLTTGAWQHVAITWDGSTSASNVRIYVNGTETSYSSSQDAVGTRNSDAIRDLRIGNNGSEAAGFDGLIDDVRIYSRALPSTDVQELYNQGNDTTAPVRSNGSPSGTLSSGTTQTTLSLATPDEAATCRYSTTAGTSYAAMTNTFTTTGGTTHSTTVSGLQDGQSYTRYVRCIDTVGNANTNDYTISFSVAAGSGTLVAHYTFDNTLIDSAGTNHGTFNGGTPSYTAGKINQAILLDGIDDYVEVPDADSLANNNTAMTWSFWARQTSYVNNAGIVAKFNTNNNRSWRILTTATDELATNLAVTTDAASTYGTSNNCGFTANNTWHHFSIVFVGGTRVSFYKDGALCQEVTSSVIASLANNTEPMVIGVSSRTGIEFNGALDDVHIYNKALSASEVADLYNQGGSSTPAPTVSLSASPTSITAGNSSTLTWSSTNATSCTASNGWSGTKATGGPHSQSVSPTVTTTYTLTCTGDGGSAQQSTTVTVTSGSDTTPPSQPTNLSATAVSASQINLSWTAAIDSQSAITSYKIYRCQGSSCTPSTLIDTIGNTTSYANTTGLSASTAYTYAVSAVSGGGEGAKSSNAWTTTHAAPTVNCTHYASPTGGGNGLSQTSPFQIANFWSVAQPGHTLCLLDGMYNTTIDPPNTVDGTATNRITVRALNDGKAIINGGSAERVLRLCDADYITVEGLNLRHNVTSGQAGIVTCATKGAIFRRIVSQGGFVSNSTYAHGAYPGTLFEDVAGVGGPSRKMFGVIRWT